MAKPALKYLDWDSKQLGVRCGIIDGINIQNLSKPAALTKHIKTLCKKKNFDFITIKLKSDFLKTVNELIKAGALLVDTELTFHYSGRTSKEDLGSIPRGVKVTFCKKCNSKSFIKLAKEMRYSRFFVDPKIPTNKALHLWQTSIKNHCEGFADKLLIAYRKNSPCGIIALRFKNDRQLFLHIVGVLAGFRGKNIGRHMLQKIIECYAKDYDICVETQSANAVAQIVYQKAGFKLHSLKYVLHYWPSPQGRKI